MPSQALFPRGKHHIVPTPLERPLADLLKFSLRAGCAAENEDMSLTVVMKLATELSLLNSFMDDLSITDEVDPWEPEDISALGHDTKAARDERMRVLRRERAGMFFTGACGGERCIYRKRWTGR